MLVCNSKHARATWSIENDHVQILYPTLQLETVWCVVNSRLEKQEMEQNI